MSADVKVPVTVEPIQEFTDKAIDDPAQLQKLSRRLRRSGWQSGRGWLILLAVAAAVALLVGLFVGRFVLP